VDLPRYLDSLTCFARAWPSGGKLRQLFDPGFYLHKYPDVAAAGVDPFHHFIKYGAKERRKPHALFDPGYYMLGCPAANAPSDPLIDFLQGSRQPWINPHPLFDCASYLKAHPAAVERGTNPLLHWVNARRSRVPHPLDLKNPHLGNVRFTFMDVSLTIAFTDEIGPGDDVVRVWEDDSGRMHFIAPPEQRPFFEAMKYDQLRAQLKQPR
jgi:hypothetical protein